MTSSNNELEDVQHKNPLDVHKLHIWCLEPQIRRGVLTADGMTQIAVHKYVSGISTYLDAVFSPVLWQPLTDLLPMWLAPNLVTTIGGFFCMITFFLSWLYLPEPPRWLYFSNGICLFLYYTLDCMDGKQARRTGSSSPLGQLFDHGMDCICNLSHLQLVQCCMLVPPHLLILLQCSLQFAFWQAQWEEYYTGILPHAAGNCGVTEVNYSMALWSILTGVFGRDYFDWPVFPGLKDQIPFLAWLAGDDELQLRHVVTIIWVTMIISLVILSWTRVYKHVQDIKVFASAMSKFLSPLLLCGVAVWGLTDFLKDNATAGRLSLGLCFCLITIKIIVYSMAKMAYASLQVDIVPFVVVVTVCRLLEVNNTIFFHMLDLLYLGRIIYWVYEAIHQLCERLQIKLFRIPYKND
jgi:ethanolaminephosphotransferase